MSIAELQARIGRLSDEIVRQKQVLQDLERQQKCGPGPAQRRSRSSGTPTPRNFIPNLHTRPSPRHAPMLFLNICNAWTDIAFSAPALWASIHVHKPMRDLDGLLDTWLERAGIYALSISLPTPITAHIAQVIRCHGPHLQDLRIFHDKGDVHLVAEAGPFPCLKTLTLARAPSDEARVTDTIDMLRPGVCPNLVECTLDDVFWVGSYTPADRLVIPHMRHLYLGEEGGSSSAGILPHLSLPGLNTLFLPYCDIEFHKPFGIFKTFFASVAKIYHGLRTVYGQWTRSEMQESLSLLPTLTHFELVELRWNSAAPNHFLSILTDSPHLGPWYQELLTTLSTRRKINSVEVVWTGLWPERPLEDVYLPLRQYVAGGMKIYIGTDERNYV
ncbi:hypothetical protein B0H17DRAFT_1185528 [Mycena rosella]|uniref:F-box domain-containing protein n=1 Tax=Mycena rosella TaxID=1033263 RepID=A0AAD7CTW0_MYCRO|nr:hypothetical protein B0H17DRAFT_1185528 [Mycena rosella]